MFIKGIVENGECKHGGNEKQCLDTMVCKKVDGVYKCQYENGNDFY